MSMYPTQADAIAYLLDQLAETVTKEAIKAAFEAAENGETEGDMGTEAVWSSEVYD